MDSAAEALTSPVELKVAARVAKTLVASGLTTAVESDCRLVARLLRSACNVW